MEIEIPAADTDITVEDDTELEPFPWAKEIGKELTLSATATAGLAGGFILVGLAYTGYTELRKRFAKKSQPEVPVITDMPAPTEA